MLTLLRCAKLLKAAWNTTPALVDRQRRSYCHVGEECYREKGISIPMEQETVPIESVYPMEPHMGTRSGDEHHDKIEAYRKLFEAGHPMPPAYVVGKGVVDGNRRYEGARRAGVMQVPILRRGKLPPRP